LEEADMAVLVVAHVPDTGEQDREVWRERNKVLAQQPGFLFQGDGPLDSAWQVVSAWESRKDFDRYFESHVLPYLPAGREITPPEIHELESIVTK
jgi:hypothetical protein